MASKSKRTKSAFTPLPDASPWKDGGDEITEPGIGVGFVQWTSHGEHLRGKLLRRWRSRAMRSPAVTIELTEIPTVGVYDSQGGGVPELVDVKRGDKVNLSLTHDLERKLTADLEKEEVGIVYVDDIATRSGSMRSFRVVTFGQRDLEF